MSRFQRRFFLILGLYLALHVLFRLLISSSLEIDEAEMVLWFQDPFHLGYNSQPPLYCWIQMVFFYIFGLNIFSLAFLKNIFIFLTYLFLYKSAKELIKNELYAVFSAVSLFLVYGFSWILHKDLTHSVLLMAVCAITVYLFIRLLHTKSIRYYILLGIFMGLGILAKYNYAIFIAALILAGLSVRGHRSALLNKKILFVSLLAVIVVAPHLWWCLGNVKQLLVDKAKLNLATGKSLVFGLHGWYIMIRETVFFLLPLFVVYSLLFREGFKKIHSASKEDNYDRHLFEKFFLFYFLIATFLIIGCNVSEIKVRWILPVLFLFPLYFFMRIKNIKVNTLKIKIFIFLVSFFAIAVLCSMPSRIALASLRHKYSRLNYPYDVLSRQIKKDYFQRGLILAADYVIGADLKLNFKDSFVVSTGPKIYLKPPDNLRQLLVVWDDQKEEEINVLKQYMASKLNLYLGNKNPVNLQALYKYSKDKNYKINLLVLDIETGE